MACVVAAIVLLSTERGIAGIARNRCAFEEVWVQHMRLADQELAPLSHEGVHSLGGSLAGWARASTLAVEYARLGEVLRNFHLSPSDL